ncbi:FxsA family protein [Thermoanaerobacterium sp. RBIITD]|uniref:FxsA family protein n=1 Tax=Thermoanaerobacterium sp. RBIITD TaxID=1550240 RepID=UPI000BB7C1DE|nr:FxsA family protein [Thermoanaerobacterium sp. RBIITD]SNX54833.1 UPF0716 protein FxsA [Thermoanaerobacterium sp. RBIITD]
MYYKILALFIVVPLIELYILIVLGKNIGVLPTILIVVGAGIVGVSMLKREGFKVIREFKNALNEGRVPGDELLNGILVLVGGVLLITPGLITDAMGFLLLIPATRNTAKRWLKSYLLYLIRGGGIRFFFRR